MKRAVLGVVGLGLLGVLLLAMVTSLTEAQTDLAQAQTIQTMAISQTVNQFFTGAAIVGALIVGGALALFGQKVIHTIQAMRIGNQAGNSRWAPGPNAHWQRMPAAGQRAALRPDTQLHIPPAGYVPNYPAGYAYPAQLPYYPQPVTAAPVVYVEADDDDGFSGFGGFAQ